MLFNTIDACFIVGLSVARLFPYDRWPAGTSGRTAGPQADDGGAGAMGKCGKIFNNNYWEEDLPSPNDED